jgi:hypothetical protein
MPLLQLFSQGSLPKLLCSQLQTSKLLNRFREDHNRAELLLHQCL